MDNMPEILKWVGIVFAAGFIGYFGRYLAMLLIERARRRKTQDMPDEAPAGRISTSVADSPEIDKVKLEKKRLKLEKKKAKKG